MRLVLFDFDGTLTTKDSLELFLKYNIDKLTYFINMFKFLPYFISYKLKFISNTIAKQKLFKIFYKGMGKEDFTKQSSDFSINILDTILREETYHKFKQHISNGDRVIIVSASIECYLKPWCQKENVELLSTRLNFVDSIFSGSFLTKNCYGQEKANRIKEYLNISEYDEVYAYGDSAGDIEMLEIASKSFWIK